jgi:hypothetical protein
MDEAGRKKLVDKLAKPARFDKAYEEADRQWCVDKLIRILGAQGTTDAGMEAAVTAVLTKAKTVVAAQRDFKVGVKLDKKRAATERASTGRRVEILYGLIATDPKLVDSPGNIAMLSFIARRRYRSIERMALFVNPNGRGYFRYPDTCSTNFSLGRWHWKVNVVASKFWEPVVAGQDVPIWLKNPPDAPAAFNPEAAIASLFTQKDAACEGNLLDCATTMNVVLMDSLMEGNKPKDFAATLAAKNPIYLSIVHVNPPIVQPEAFFLTDPTAEGLFVKGGAALEDLQVGDHVYIRNHQLYKTLRPTGSWSGEHALVTDCGNRHIDSDKGFKFMGHGMPHGGETGAIPRFYKGLLNEINTHLHRSFRLAAIFLDDYHVTPGPAVVRVREVIDRLVETTFAPRDLVASPHTVGFSVRVLRIRLGPEPAVLRDVVRLRRGHRGRTARAPAARSLSSPSRG